MVTLKRLAIVVKPKRPFLDWLPGPIPRASPCKSWYGSSDLLDPRCDTNAEVDEVLRELGEEIFIEQLAGWFNDRTTEQLGPRIVASRSSAGGSTSTPFDVGGSLRPPGSRIRLNVITCGALACEDAI
jgi:hypothetical protein